MRREILAKQLILLVFTSIALQLWTFDEARYRSLPHWPDLPRSSTSSHFATWDTAFYLRLTDHGYKRESPLCAFYPLWPGFIRSVTWLTFGNPLVAGMLLTNVMMLIGLQLFYQISKDTNGELVARKGLILLLAFPGALFFCFPYTESLFFLMVMLFFRGLHQGQYFWPCVVGLFAPLAKALGIILLVPLAWHLLERNKPLRNWSMLLLPMLGYGMYFGFMHLSTGNAFEGFVAQKHYPNSPSIGNIFNFPGFWKAFMNMGSFDGMTDSILDRVFFVLALVLLPWVYRLNRVWFFYALPMVLVPALSSWFMSYRRYLMVCFPLFIVLAQLFERLQNRFVFWYYVVLLFAVQLYAVMKFVSFEWAG